MRELLSAKGIQISSLRSIDYCCFNSTAPPGKLCAQVAEPAVTVTGVQLQGPQLQEQGFDWTPE